MLSEERHKAKIPEEFQRYFWDVTFDELSWVKNRQFIAERLLNYGGPREIKWLLSYTGNQFIKSVIKNSRNLNAKTKNYWEIMLTPANRKSR